MCAKDSLISPREYYKLPEVLKKLRKIHGETQEDLANAIGLTKSAISNYENGHRTPELNELRSLARHFNMTVPALLRGDYTDTDGIEIPKKLPLDRPEVQKTYFEAMFPCFWLEKDMKNEHFRSALEFSNKLFQDILNGNPVECSQIEKSIELYEKAGAYLAMSACVGLLRWAVILAYLTSVSGTKEEIMFDYKKQKEIYLNFRKYHKSIYLLTIDDKVDKKHEQEKKEAMREYRHNILENITNLKHVDCHQFSLLADFYLAFCYLLNIIGNELSREENRLIGLEMLELCGMFKNQYALNFIELEALS